MYRSLVTFLAISLLQVGVFGQEVVTRGYFSQDTVQLGEPVSFTMIVDYPRGIEVLFPDSTFDFSPFEYLDKNYLNTVSDLDNSNDSVVYQLATFELDTIQRLKLPVFLISDGDSVLIDSNTDSVYLQHMITSDLDSLNIQETIDYQKVSKAFNYPYLMIALGILAVVALAVAFFFGSEIRRKYKLYRLRKAHLKFLEKFKELQNEGLETSEKAEQLLGFWKKYLEKLEGLPYTKLTTREIVTLEQNQEFKETLRSIDSSIYGEFKGTDINSLVIKLKEFGIDRFIRKVDELKHA